MMMQATRIALTNRMAVVAALKQFANDVLKQVRNSQCI